MSRSEGLVLNGNYTTILFLLVILCTFIEAWMALKYIRISTLLRMICQDLITPDLRHRGMPCSEEDVGEELSRLLEQKEEEL